MTEHLHLRRHNVQRTDRADGSILLSSGVDLGPVARTAGTWLKYWSDTAPDRTFLAERSGAGWRQVSYREAYDRALGLAAGLLDRGLGADGPILILSDNSVDHALLSLAAHHVGIVTVPVAEQYSLIPEARTRLAYIAHLVKPAAVFADDPQRFAEALKMIRAPVLCSVPNVDGALDLDALVAEPGADVHEAHARTGPETVAKILLTSGSTSDPKGVLTTQRMMTTNQAQIAACLPFLTEHPPVLVDWLPWKHVFGGSHNFNMVLANGGTLYIDDGKPLPNLFPRTLENLGMVSGTISFNVPVGFAQLVTALKNDAGLRRTYFSQLDMIFYAGASLPQDTWSELERLALEELGHLPLITSSWGLTETAPGALLQHEPARGAGIVGVPLPGVTVKLEDDGFGRMAVGVRGSNVCEGYLDDPDKTRDAFDDEGFFRTGDAMQFVDPADMNRGLRFAGRTSEDFKLATGTWVQAPALRLNMLAVLAPYAADVVICGAGRTSLGLLILPNRSAVQGEGFELKPDGAGAYLCPELQERLAIILSAEAARATGSATRIERALILSDLPEVGAGEITAKGNLNFARLLERRAALVDRLYDDADPAMILAV